MFQSSTVTVMLITWKCYCGIDISQKTSSPSVTFLDKDQTELLDSMLAIKRTWQSKPFVHALLYLSRPPTVVLMKVWCQWCSTCTPPTVALSTATLQNLPAKLWWELQLTVTVVITNLGFLVDYSCKQTRWLWWEGAWGWSDIKQALENSTATLEIQ